VETKDPDCRERDLEGERDWEGETEVVRAFENGRDVLEEGDVVWKRDRERETEREIELDC
jgi:hypothetical protein